MSKLLVTQLPDISYYKKTVILVKTVTAVQSVTCYLISILHFTSIFTAIF